MTEQRVASDRRPPLYPAQGLARLLPALAEDDRSWFRDLTVFGGGLFVAAFVVWLWSVDWSGAIPRDGTGLAVGRDFLNFWMYGRAAASDAPGHFYDVTAYHQALRSLLGAEFNGQNWSYPPSIMLLAAPFGQLGYLVALVSWMAVTITIFLAAARHAVTDWRVLIPVMLSPAALFCVISGQSSFLIAGMLIAIFAWLDRRPVAAGLLIGLLTIKPQLGILFPFMLAASGRWRVFTVSAITAVAIVAVTAAIFGPRVWIEFVSKGLPVQALVLADPDRIATPFFSTVFMNLRGINLGYAPAMTVQAVFSVLAAAAVVWVARDRSHVDPPLFLALFLACTVCASPYLLIYDLLPLTFAAVTLMAAGRLDKVGRRLAQLVYWTPALQLVLGTWHVPGPALIAPVFAAYLAIRLRGESHPTPAMA